MDKEYFLYVLGSNVFMTIAKCSKGFMKPKIIDNGKDQCTTIITGENIFKDSHTKS